MATQINQKNSPAYPDLGSLERDSEFRAHMMFFLGLANTYIVQIFWHVFNNSRSRKKLYFAIEDIECAENAQKQAAARKKERIDRRSLLSDNFKQQIFASAHSKTPHFDAYSNDFLKLVRKLDEKNKTRFKNILIEHAIPLTFTEFVDLVDELRLKRHYLKTWKPNMSKRFKEAKVIRALGLLLLSKQHQHLIGAATHAAKRLNIKFDSRALQYHLSQARKSRAEASLAYYGKRRKKSELSRAERKMRENSMTAIQARYTEFYPQGCWPRYNFHNFKIRHYVYGKSRIDLARNLLTQNLSKNKKPDQTLHFQRDIESILETATQIGRILHLAIFRLAEADKSLTKAQKKDRQDCFQGRLREIRNAIAHNTLFFTIHAKRVNGTADNASVLLSLQQVFVPVFAAFYKPHVVAALGSPSQNINDIVTKIASLLKKQDYHWAFPVRQGEAEGPDHTPPKVIRYWGTDIRDTYTDRKTWRLDKREAVRSLCADWHSQLERARENGKPTPKPGENGAQK